MSEITGSCVNDYEHNCLQLQTKVRIVTSQETIIFKKSNNFLKSAQILLIRKKNTVIVTYF
jgi:hypothetical protein